MSKGNLQFDSLLPLHLKQMHPAVVTCNCKDSASWQSCPGKAGPQTSSKGKRNYDAFRCICKIWQVDHHCLGRLGLDQVSKGGVNDRPPLPPPAFSHPGGSHTAAHGNSIAVTRGHILPIHYHYLRYLDLSSEHLIGRSCCLSCP